MFFLFETFSFFEEYSCSCVSIVSHLQVIYDWNVAFKRLWQQCQTEIEGQCDEKLDRLTWFQSKFGSNIQHRQYLLSPYRHRVFPNTAAQEAAAWFRKSTGFVITRFVSRECLNVSFTPQQGFLKKHPGILKRFKNIILFTRKKLRVAVCCQSLDRMQRSKAFIRVYPCLELLKYRIRLEAYCYRRHPRGHARSVWM